MSIRLPTGARAAISRGLSNDDALRLLAADMHTPNDEVRQVVGQCFFAKDDRRLGFYTLMLNTGNQWDPSETLDVSFDEEGLLPGEGSEVKFDPLEDHPESPLAQYIASQLHYQNVGHSEDPPAIEWPNSGFIQELADFRRQYVRWTSGRAYPDGDPFDLSPYPIRSG